jgi:thiamine kinase-like enzyme
VTDLPRLSPTQQAVVHEWLPDAELVADLSWELMGTAVLHVRTPEGDFIVKAGGPTNHHIDREINAHLQFTAPWVAENRAARMLRHDQCEKILLLNYLSGVLIEGTPAENEPEIYRQAGTMLAELHAQGSRDDLEYELREISKSMNLLDTDHRIAPETVDALRARLRACEPQPVTLVPTHGDWHPRNWLLDDGIVRAIDFGRAAWRPAYTDLARLATRQWLANPDLETAFLAGYGPDPRTPPLWRILLIREAIGTAVWAHQFGDEAFEREGHRMIANVLTGAMV